MKRLEEQLQTINAKILTELVHKAKDNPVAEVVDFSCTKISPRDHPITAGVYRFSGNSRIQNQDQLQPWSLVLKVIRYTDVTGRFGQDYFAIPDHVGFWKREALVFQSGILNDWNGGLVPVRCYGAAEKGTDSIWLWLEDMQKAADTEWSLDRHILAARHFGEFNGAHLEHRITVLPWLNRSFLRQFTALFYQPGDTFGSSDLWNHPAVKKAFSRSIVERMLHVLDNRDNILNKLDRQTQALSHQDTDRRNLFTKRGAGGQEQTVVIDWGFLGLAAVGEDLGNQVLGNLFHFAVDCSKAREYQQAAFESYVDGLHEVGWHDSVEYVRLASSAQALQYLVVVPTLLEDFVRNSSLPYWVDSWAQQHGCTAQEGLLHWGGTIHPILDAAEEVWKQTES